MPAEQSGERFHVATDVEFVVAETFGVEVGKPALVVRDAEDAAPFFDVVTFAGLRALFFEVCEVVAFQRGDVDGQFAEKISAPVSGMVRSAPMRCRS